MFSIFFFHKRLIGVFIVVECESMVMVKAIFGSTFIFKLHFQLLDTFSTVCSLIFCFPSDIDFAKCTQNYNVLCTHFFLIETHSDYIHWFYFLLFYLFLSFFFYFHNFVCMKFMTFSHSNYNYLSELIEYTLKVNNVNWLNIIFVKKHLIVCSTLISQ